MAAKVSSLLSYAFLFLFLVIFHAKLAKGEIPSSSSSRSAFEFIKPLQGSKKGDKVEGLYNLKKYLKTFGYIDDLPYSSSSPGADYFSDQLESAIRTYQTNFHLNSTGVLDAATVSQMVKPRCGVADIINGTNLMQRPRRLGASQVVVPQYAFMPGTPKWPDDKRFLKYGWGPGTPDKFFAPTASAFRQWRNAAANHFTFKRVQYDKADLKLHLFSGEHGDGHPFDGRGGVFAHTFQPPFGISHFDAEENWVEYGPIRADGLDIESVVVHEMGHILGLDHSEDPHAVMSPHFEYGQERRDLTRDDIDGIRALYHIR